MSGESREEPRPRRLLCSRRLLTPGGLHDGALLLRGEVIEAVLAVEEARELAASGVPADDVGNAVVMPGLVDLHVHINEPGRTHWEGFETATRAAAAGGITTLVDMPLNSSPVTTEVAALRSKATAAVGQLWVDCGFHGGLVAGSSAVAIEGLLEAGVCGVKAFLVDSGIEEFPPAGEGDLRRVMPVLARHEVPLLVHAELPAGRSAWAPRTRAEARSYPAYLASRPDRWEVRAIERLIDLCRETGCAVHIVHLATAEALPCLRAARLEGLPVTVETCPHYLVFEAESIRDGDTRFKCAPPIRAREHREALWRALATGEIDLVASDHSPAPPALKELESGDFSRAWGGIASLQCCLSAVWTEAHRRGFGPEDLARWMSTRPAERLGLSGSKGSLQPGHDADLVVWHPEESWQVDGEALEHRHAPTPYHGLTLLGRVDETWLRGRRVYSRGRFSGPPRGRILHRDAEASRP